MWNAELSRRAQEALRAAALTPRRLSGLHYSTVYAILRGERVGPTALARFAHAIGGNPVEWLRVGRPDLVPEARDDVSEVRAQDSTAITNSRLPVMGTLRRGVMVPVEAGVDDHLPCLPEHANSQHFIVRCGGYSMFPKIEPGDYLVLRHATQARRGEIVMAGHGETVVVRYFLGRTRRGYLLVSENPEYPNIEDADIKIRGVAVWQCRPGQALTRTSRP